MRDQFRMSDTTDELDAIQRRLLELSELFPLTFWKNLDRLNVQEQRTPRWSFLINSNGIQVILHTNILKTENFDFFQNDFFRPKLSPKGH